MRRYIFPRVVLLAGLFSCTVAWADATPQVLPFAQNWSNAALIAGDDNWSGVPGIAGYRGDGLTASTGVNPGSILADGNSTPLDVNANRTDPDTFSTGGVAEFELTDPVVALNGSGTADAPFLQISLDTRGFAGIDVAYLLRDLDGSTDNAIQPVALQYRIGSVGSFANVPAAYVADATEGPGLAGKTTAVNVQLPADADNQPVLQIRVITSNAVGNDEWVGVDDISVTGSPASGNQPILATCPATLNVVSGGAASVQLSATDADSRVNNATLNGGAAAGISLSQFSAAMLDGETATVQLDATGLATGSYPVVVRFDNDDAQSTTCTVTVEVKAITPIPQIQGAGPVSTLAGQRVTTEGVVTKLNNNGFYLQDETGDGDITTSDGIFVFTGTAPAVSVGDKLRLSADVVEFNTGAAGNPVTAANPLTELSNIGDVSHLASGVAIAPTPISFPENFEGELERHEGMLVSINALLTASQNFFQGRFGQVTLGAGSRLIKPTNLYRPGTAEALALADVNARRRIILDDGTSIQNPNPIPYIGTDNTLRSGDTLTGLTGVIDYGLATSSSMGIADYRIHPVDAVNFSRENARSAGPLEVDGNVRVASFNVLNYFTTIDQSGASCFPGGGRADCRGADSAAEFTRQRDKIVTALAAINADAVGLIEMENNGNVAVSDLVAALNTRMGAGTYASVEMPTGGSGGDAIRVAMIYKPITLVAAGSPISDTNSVHNRPPLAQTFAAANGERFTIIVNHFKSKGSCPADINDPNADQGDGQGCWNPLRVQQAQALMSFIGGIVSTSGDGDVIVMGDLNAYGRENPVTEFLDNGYVDLVSNFNGEAGYSFVFDGESGYLDHALATAGMAGQITGATEWHVNADEPSVIDYNTEFKPQDLYMPDAYRSSDHDPVIVGMMLRKNLSGTAGRDAIVGTPGDDLISGGLGADNLTGGGGRDVFVYASMRDAVDTITDFTPSTDRVDLRALLDGLGIPANVALTGGYVRIVNVSAGASVQIDTDGSVGSATYRSLLILKGIDAGLIDPARDLMLD